ncbi:hypothetical protein AAF712_008213 [Marasmius tenuissimus]|uniref:FAD-binding PCMH-type domain-containing protein n=1 Tax=Marasmius tenuissimus TaxID=585030 RepID=A0ABR2ZUN2_9AGAR
MFMRVFALCTFLPVAFAERCRILPSDDSWPTSQQWNAFNESVDGRLIRTIPVGSPCHDPNFDQEKCDAVRAGWATPGVHTSSPSSVMDSLYTNQSCDPFTPRERPCEIGAYVQYSVNVSSPEHVIKTINMVKEHNIRFVVKNTGHDFMGRSTATGAISIWTHHLQNIAWFPNFTGPTYTGSAVKAHAGVSGGDLLSFAGEHGHTVVTGDCPSVGFAGGYVQGGGHSAITNVYGLAADQVLEFEVITPQGQFVVASPSENEDLFWALQGGGGGTYAIVWSVTVKAHLDAHVSVGFLNFTVTTGTEDYWKAVHAYQAIIPNITDSKMSALATYSPPAFGITPIVALNKSESDIREVFQPLVQTLDALGVNCSFTTFSKATYLEGYKNAGFPETPVGGQLNGGRLLPRSLWESEASFDALKNTIRGVIDSGAAAWEITLRPTLEVAGHPENAILPAWREAQTLFTPVVAYPPTTPFEQLLRDQNRITNEFDPPLKKLAPESGAYLNEANVDDPDFKQSFYGVNYDRLLAIKDKWDPDEILYGSIAVGGDRWYQNVDGRLCRR